MKPKIIEFHNDTELIKEAKNLASKGVSKENLYVISHDSNRDKKVAESIDASRVGMKEEGLETFVKNIFRKKGDELRAQFKKFGFDQTEAKVLESKLDAGKILLLYVE